MLTDKALAIATRVSSEGVLTPLSICDIASRVREVASANSAWVIPFALRCSRIADPICFAAFMSGQLTLLLNNGIRQHYEFYINNRSEVL